MAKTEFKSVGDYIASRPLGARLALTRVRNVIRQALPGAEEVISDGMPAYKIADEYVVLFAGGKGDFSISPASEKIAATLKKRLARYTISRGNIHFPLSQPMPVDLITSIAKLRAKECAESEKASKDSKTAAKKKAVAKKPAKKTAKKAVKKPAKAAKKAAKRGSSSKKPKTGKKS